MAWTKGFLVTLESDIHEDDGEATINAIRMVKGVIAVDPVESSPFQELMMGTQIKYELRKKILEVLK